MTSPRDIEAIAKREGVAASDICVERVKICSKDGHLHYETNYRIRRRGLQYLIDQFLTQYGLENPRARLAVQAATIRSICLRKQRGRQHQTTIRDCLSAAWAEAIENWQRLVEPVSAPPIAKQIHWADPVNIAALESAWLPDRVGCIAATPHRLEEILPGDVLLLERVESLRRSFSGLRSDGTLGVHPQRHAWACLVLWTQMFGQRFTNLRWTDSASSEYVVAVLREYYVPHF